MTLKKMTLNAHLDDSAVERCEDPWSVWMVGGLRERDERDERDEREPTPCEKRRKRGMSSIA